MGWGLEALIEHIERLAGTQSTGRVLAINAMGHAFSTSDFCFTPEQLDEAGATLSPAEKERQATANAEQFARYVNALVEPAYELRARPDAFVWSLYGSVLRSKELPRRSPETLQAFAARQGDFDRGERGAGYWDTQIAAGVEVWNPSAWKHVQLAVPPDEVAGSRATRGVLDIVRNLRWTQTQWLEGSQVATLSAELSIVEVRRPWFDWDLFRARDWNWTEGPISDGGSPPSGAMPAVVIGLVLARNLSVELAQPGASVSRLALSQTWLSLNKAQAAARAVSASASASASESTAKGLGGQQFGFPIPVRIDAPWLLTDLRGQLEGKDREREQASAAVKAMEEELAKPPPPVIPVMNAAAVLGAAYGFAGPRRPTPVIRRNQSVTVVQPNRGVIPSVAGPRRPTPVIRRNQSVTVVQPNRGVIPSVVVASVPASDLGAKLAQARQRLTELEGQAADLRSLVDELTASSQPAAANEFSVFAAIVEWLPRCPNPDPTLFDR
jgi:hypothetical protein